MHNFQRLITNVLLFDSYYVKTILGYNYLLPLLILVDSHTHHLI
jgi:hypothetical protein